MPSKLERQRLEYSLGGNGMAPWASFAVPVEKTTLQVYRTGGDKPVVLLAHGFADSAMCWTTVAQRLENQFDVIMYDARGHGLSPLPEEGMDREAMIDDLAQLIQALGLERPPLMGHSMGAGTVAGAAAKYPELMRGIVLEDPPWRDAVERADFSGFRQRLLDETRKSRSMPREAIAEMRQASHPTWPAAECLAWADSRLQLDLRIFDRVGELTPDWRPTAAAIQCPTLLLRADPELGGIVTAQAAAEATSLNARIKDVHIGNAGHGLRREQLDAFCAAVTPFFAELYAA